jgi:hypothetical protein
MDVGGQFDEGSGEVVDASPRASQSAARVGAAYCLYVDIWGGTAAVATGRPDRACNARLTGSHLAQMGGWR